MEAARRVPGNRLASGRFDPLRGGSKPLMLVLRRLTRGRARASGVECIGLMGEGIWGAPMAGFRDPELQGQAASEKARGGSRWT